MIHTRILVYGIIRIIIKLFWNEIGNYGNISQAEWISTFNYSRYINVIICTIFMSQMTTFLKYKLWICKMLESKYYLYFIVFLYCE